MGFDAEGRCADSAYREIHEWQGRGALRLLGFGIDAGKGVLKDDGQEQRFVRDCEGGAFKRGRCRAFRLRPEGQIQDAFRRKNLFRRNRGGRNRFFGQRFCLALHPANLPVAHNDERLGHPVVPSMAAALVAGGTRNGLTFWKNKDRKELKSLGK